MQPREEQIRQQTLIKMDFDHVLSIIGVPNTVLLVSFSVVIVVIAFGLYSNRVVDKKAYILWILLIEYSLIVLCATVICRPERLHQRVEPMPFWIYMEVLNGNPKVTPLDIFFNIILLLPLGVLLAGVLPSFRLGKIFFIGLLISLIIETLQYVLLKGVAQFDDLIHNSFGCVLGWYTGKNWLLNKKVVVK